MMKKESYIIAAALIVLGFPVSLIAQDTVDPDDFLHCLRTHIQPSRETINWDKFREDLEIAGREAAKRTNKRLAVEEVRLIEKQNAEIAEIWKAVKMLP
jgi:hypothetical protein